MKTSMLSYDKVTITGGFWKKRQDINREVTIWNVYKRFKETGRLDAFKMNWKEGDPNKPHIFWDSDVAKWLESAAYLTMKKRDAELEAIVDEVVDDIERGRMEDGYFNIYYELFEKDRRFTGPCTKTIRSAKSTGSDPPCRRCRPPCPRWCTATYPPCRGRPWHRRTVPARSRNPSAAPDIEGP